VNAAPADHPAAEGDIRVAEGEIRVAAPAKLNLYLHIVGRRDDGYHLLDSLIAFADVCDVLRVRRAGRLRLEIAGEFSAPLKKGRNNLVLRAARGLAALGGIEAEAEIMLEKRLPVAAGLGGGSADAAAALIALDRLWATRADAADLRALALSLGADVPVCLDGGAAFVGGIGERIDPAPALPPLPLVLVNPGRHLSTSKVYAARRGPYSQPGDGGSGARFGSAPELADWLAARGNDLTAGAAELAPDIRAVLDQLAAAPGCLLARMSGSGATCFGLFGDDAAARREADALAARNPRWWVRAGRTLAGAAERDGL
jgi:4-diphosphocytidyl-2-C-methyl-D-erythritol kinase